MLKVYICKKCGRYRYVTSHNFICYKCNAAMQHADIEYEDYIKLTENKRDEIIKKYMGGH